MPGEISSRSNRLFVKAKTDFLEYLELEQGRSQKTLANYDHYLTRLVDYAGDELTISQIDAELIRKWRLWLNRLGTNTSDELQKSTTNYDLIALRSFLNSAPSATGLPCPPIRSNWLRLSASKSPS